MIYPRQISKVVYEAIRAYGVTVGEPEKKSWEQASQADRDEIMVKVDALLRGEPHAPGSIRPSEQVKAKLLSGIVGAFVQVFNPPPAPFIAPVPPVVAPVIPVEIFPDPDVVPLTGLVGGVQYNDDGSVRAEKSIGAKIHDALFGEPVIETKHYADGSSATGVAPLPDHSPSGSPTVESAMAQADAHIAEANL